MTPALAAAIIRPEDRLASTTALALASRVISTIPDPDGRLHAGIMAAMNAVYEMQKACAPRPVLVDEKPQQIVLQALHHIDGDPYNNATENLVRVSPGENRGGAR